MTFYDQISINKRRSFFLVLFFFLIMVSLGYLFARIYNSPAILIGVIVFSTIQALIGYYSGEKIALAVNRAHQIQKKDNPKLWNKVENLCIAAGEPMPKIYVIDDPAPNAFATGRDPKHSSLAVTSGLLEIMNDAELEGVIAHELSHIKNFDIRLMTLVVVLVGAISLLADLFFRLRFFGSGSDEENNNGGQSQIIILVITILVAILAPLIATLIQLAISRKREFLADSTGVSLTRYPEGLASALEKIGNYKEPMQNVSNSTAHLFIANPFGRAGSYISKLFSTHPPIEERVAALRKMGQLEY